MKFRYQNQIPARSRGQAIVEFAIVLPVLLMMLVGVLEVGRMIYIYAAVHNASREAARYASAMGLDDNGLLKYKYCAGIQHQARRSAFFVPLVIDIRYDQGPNDPVYTDGHGPDDAAEWSLLTRVCDASSGEDADVTVSSLDRVLVQVNTVYSPLLRLIPVSSRTVASTSARTILGIVEMEALVTTGGGGGGGGGSATTPAATSPVTTTVPTNTSTATTTPTSTATSSGPWMTFTPHPTDSPAATALPTNTPTVTATATATATATPTATGSVPTCSASAVTLNASEDTWLDQSSPSTAGNGSATTLSVQSRHGNRNMRALVQFSLPSMPDGCVVQSATLRLYASSSTNGRTLQALQISSAWTESSVTWNTQPSTTGNAATTASGTGAAYREWIVTDIVKAIYSSTNYGFLIQDATEGTNGSGELQRFNSSENGANMPQLVITFGQAP